MPLEFSAQSKQRVERLLSRYPTKQAALLPVLHVAQEEFGHLPDDVIKMGRNELMVCTNISCMLKGGYGILKHIEQRLGIKAGETTPDGAFSIVEEECLAACANAPMMICGDDYFLDLTPEKVDVVLDELRKRFREDQKSAPLTRTMFGMGPGGEKG